MASLAGVFRRLIQLLDLKTGFWRFPASFVVAAIGTLIIVWDQAVRDVPDLLSDQIFPGLVIGFFAAMLTTLAAEKRNVPVRRHTIYGAIACAMGLAAFFLPEPWRPAPTEFPIMTAVGLAFLAGIAAFPIKAPNLDRFWVWHARTIVYGVLAYLGAGLFLLGIAAVDSALDVLFNVDLGNFVFEVISPIAILFLAPAAWLSMIPRVADLPAEIGSEDNVIRRAVSVLAQFVAAPLLAIYAVLLIAYAAKIAVTGVLPVNQIGWMVTAFGVVGAATILALYPDRESGNRLALIFWRYWFAATLIPIALLFVAVYVRIAAYGLTEERVLLVLGAVWLLTLGIVFAISRSARDIRLISGLAGVLLLIFSFGPQGLVGLSIASQATRFQAMITQAGGPTTSLSAESVSDDVARELRETIRYLKGRDDDLSRLRATAETMGWPGDGGGDETLEAFLIAKLDLNRLPARTPTHSLVAHADFGVVEAANGARLVGPIPVRRWVDNPDEAGVHGFGLSIDAFKLTIDRHGEARTLDLREVGGDRDGRLAALSDLTTTLDFPDAKVHVVFLDYRLSIDRDDTYVFDGEILLLETPKGP